MDLAERDRVLTAKGYAIKKSSLTPKTVQNIRRDLTVSPEISVKFARGSGTTFTVYTESPTRFYVPRMWGREHFGIAEAEAVSPGDSLRSDLQFQGVPYDYQTAIVDEFLQKGANGLICVPCGRGKTFMAIWTAMRIGKKFLIVVDKEFLLQQWKGELEQLVPGIRIGILQEEKIQIGKEIRVGKEPTLNELKKKLKELGDSVTGTKEVLMTRLREKGMDIKPAVEEIHFDCTIAMIQTLVLRTFPPGTFKSFGFTIFDECHHLGAQHFSRALLKIQTQSMLGLSATPVREDGLTKVFEWFLGKPVYWEKVREPDASVCVRVIDFESDDADYNEVPTDWKGDMVMARLLTKVVECTERTRIITDCIKDICEKEPKRRILVLSERISHLQTIETYLKPTGLTMSYYIGGMKEEIRETGAKEARILLASYAMASEAMNIKTLNTVVLASPRKKVEQSTGRILRLRPEQRDVAPLIVDIVDCHSVYRGQFYKRLKYYKQCGYQIQRKKNDEVETKEETQPDANGCLILDEI
jgi:superfamily II DNA or RNA helicase